MQGQRPALAYRRISSFHTPYDHLLQPLNYKVQRTTELHATGLHGCPFARAVTFGNDDKFVVGVDVDTFVADDDDVA